MVSLTNPHYPTYRPALKVPRLKRRGLHVINATSILKFSAADAGDIFTLDGEDWNHKLLEARLKCTKPAEIATVNDKKEDPRATQTALVQLLASKARAL